MDKIDNINERSDSVNTILSRPPGWLLRWGPVLFLFVFMIILSAAYLIRYPDVIEGIAEVKATDSMPHQDKRLFAQIQIPAFQKSEIQVNQKAEIELYNYPYSEYGVLKGEVKDIALNDKGMLDVDLTLPSNCITSKGKKLVLNLAQKNIGTAHIYTLPKSLLERIFKKLK